jgi:hypothetical protein
VRRDAIVAMLSVVLAVSAFIATGRSQTPARDATSASPATGSASISGTVVSDDERRMPLRRVVLTLSRVGGADQRQTATDDRGRYLFEHLAGAVYTISAAKGGYVTTSYGAARPGQPASPIPLAEGQRFAANALPLMRGGVIAGRLTNAKGRPMPANTTVQAFALRVVNGQRRISPGQQGYASVDPHGAYRMYGLAPGDYVVAVSASGLSTLAEMREMTAAEIVWAEQQARASGAAPSPAVPTQPVSSAADGPAAGRTVTYAVSYFPGTVDLATAGVVSLGRGEERTDVDVLVQPVPTARVAGIVTGPDGRPLPNTSVFRAPRNADPITELVATAGRSGTDGRFMIANVPPGDYTLVARGNAQPTAEAGRGAAPPAPLWGTADVRVQGTDISDIAIQMATGVRVSGRLVFQGDAAPPANLARFLPRLGALASAPFVSTASGVSVEADGAFRTEAMAGLYRFTVSTPTGTGDSAWVVKSATSDGRDILDAPLDLRSGADVTDIVVTFTDRPTQLSGTLTDGSGRPAPALSVLLYAADRQYWTDASRWVKTVRAGVDGAYTIAGLPAGEYYLCALTELEPAQMFDPDFLAQLVPASIKLTLAEGEKRVQNLRVGS